MMSIVINNYWQLNLLIVSLQQQKNKKYSITYPNHSNITDVKYTDAPFPRDAATKMNPIFQKILTQKGHGHYGIIIMDFPTESLVSTIIGSN
jgi:hypothetical protein